MKDDLINAMADLDEERALALVKEKLERGETAFEIVEQCRKGVEIVGQRYSEGIYYLSDLIMSEEIFREVMELVEPYFPKEFSEHGTKVVMGTIEGDIHDLGKNIMVYLLRSVGFRVIDLGVDVAPERFVRAIKETGAAIMGICVLLTFCIGSVKKVVDLLKESGLRNDVVVVIGGYPVNEMVKEYTGADYYANDAAKGLEIFKRLSSLKTSKK